MEQRWYNDDRVVGTVLIVLGIVSVTMRPFEKVDRFIQGQAEQVLTVSLVILAILIVLIAFHGRPALKALTLLWIVTP